MERQTERQPTAEDYERKLRAIGFIPLVICKDDEGRATNAPGNAMYRCIERMERLRSYREGNTLRKIVGTLRLIGDIEINDLYYFYEAKDQIKRIWRK